MRIGFDAKRAFLNGTGLGNYSRTTLIALKKYFPENDYVLFTPEIKGDLFPEQNNFEIISPDNPTSKILKSFWRSISLSRVLAKREVDLFHGLSHELPIGIQNTGVPSVVTIHDLIFMRFPHFYKALDRKIYLQKLKFATDTANKIIAISEQTRDDIINLLQVNPEKIEVVYQAISERYFVPSDTNMKSEVVKKYDLPQKYILSLGTIESRKNQLNILKAIHEKGIDLPLVIVGKPTTYVQKLLDFITEHNMEDKVKFLGSVTDEDLPYVYQNAEMLIYISFFEGFGLPLIEAMASECPVLTSDVSCLPEVGGDASLLCKPNNVNDIGDKIEQLIQDKNLRKQLITKGLERSKGFKPEKSVASLMNIYKSVVENGRGY